MGFSKQQATAALAACDGSIDRAVEWLFSRADELDTIGQDDVQAADGADKGEVASTVRILQFISLR